MELTPGFYKQMLDHLAEGVYFVDSERRILYWNEKAAEISGYDATSMLGVCCQKSRLDHMDEELQSLCSGRCPLVQALETGKPVEARVFLRHKGGHRVPVDVKVAPMRDEEGRVVGAVELFSDATAAVQVEKLNASLQKLIHIDPLTRIPNRRALVEALERELQRFRRYGTAFSIAFADIDHFKTVNDTFGHAVGDEALQWFARKVSGSLRKTDLVGRYGGEEFVILLTATNVFAAERIAEQLRQHLSDAPCPCTETVITCSFGVTGVTGDDSVASLVDRADAALYLSKRQGRNRVTRL